MRDAIVYGYSIAEDYIHANHEFNICRIFDEIDYQIVNKLIDYCGSNKENVLLAIEDWIKRAEADYKYEIEDWFNSLWL